MTSDHLIQTRTAVTGTSRWIAAARALETSREDRLFNDPWAESMAGETGKAALNAAPYNPFLPVRTRYFDDQILRTAEAGSQIVLLGAGLDTRAFRLPLPAGCTVFEVDYPEAFTGKEAILGTAQPHGELRRVPADLSGPWTDALLNAGFDTGKRTVWLAEGLFYYLSASAAESLVHAAATLSATGSTFLADIFGTGLLALDSMAALVAARKTNGRPLPFCTDTPEALFTAGGWTTATVVHPGMRQANYGRLGVSFDDPASGQDSALRTHLVTATLA